MSLHTFINLRLDVVALVALVLAGVWFCRRALRARGTAAPRLPLAALIAAGILVIAAGVLAEGAGNRQRRMLQQVFAGFGPTYAQGLMQRGHAKIRFDTPADDPTYLALIETEKSWLRLNPLLADIYTVRLDAEGKVRFVVDAETDYDRNGRFEGEREQRTRIGEVYEEATPEFFQAFEGRTVFDDSLVPDRWGLWVSSLSPIYDSAGRVEAVVGIDYSGAAWISAIAARRWLVLISTLFVVGLILAGSTLVTLLRGEIADRTAAQRALQEAKLAADAANRAKGEFLAIMSHEIRTPLNAITGYASMLEDSPLDAVQQRYVQTLRRGATALVDLLNNILDYSRIEEGRLELEAAPCQPAEIIRDVIELLSVSAREKKLNVTFHNQLGGPLTIIGDHARLRQVVLNLVSNAVKFTSRGEVTVTATWTPTSAAPESGVLAISIRDTGTGIAAETLPHLFQMFAQASAGTARRFGGSGLGLAISRQLVEMMRGKIAVQSELGAGSEFTVTIPAERVVMTAPPEPPPDEPLPKIAAGRRVLVVDDDRINREVLKAMLISSGCVVETVGNGDDAVRLALERDYAAILMDVAMPGTDGIAATERIRAGQTGRRSAIFAVTAATGREDRERCEAAGMDGFIPKPVDRHELLARLAALDDRPMPAPKTDS